jgi:hypothetical protein
LESAGVWLLTYGREHVHVILVIWIFLIYRLFGNAQNVREIKMMWGLEGNYKVGSWQSFIWDDIKLSYEMHFLSIKMAPAPTSSFQTQVRTRKRYNK